MYLPSTPLTTCIQLQNALLFSLSLASSPEITIIIYYILYTHVTLLLRNPCLILRIEDLKYCFLFCHCSCVFMTPSQAWAAQHLCIFSQWGAAVGLWPDTGHQGSQLCHQLLQLSPLSWRAVPSPFLWLQHEHNSDIRESSRFLPLPCRRLWTPRQLQLCVCSHRAVAELHLSTLISH